MSNIEAIGALLYGPYIILFEIAGIILLVAMTEYRESLYRAAVHDFKVPLIVQRDVQLELRPKGNRSLSDDLRVIDRGLLRVSLDSFSFAGSRGVHTAGSGTVTSIQEDIGLGRVSVNPSGTEPWHLLGVSPVGVFAAASAARMTVEESRRYRANPQKVATDLLDPDDPTLLIPGDDRVLDLEGICRELSASPGWRGRLHSR